MPTEQQIIAAERQALMGLLGQVPLRSVDENLVVASWNIAQFSDGKSARALQYIADICERFDIVAIQEVKSNLNGLARLQKLLPGGRYASSSPTRPATTSAWPFSTISGRSRARVSSARSPSTARLPSRTCSSSSARRTAPRSAPAGSTSRWCRCTSRKARGTASWA